MEIESQKKFARINSLMRLTILQLNLLLQGMHTQFQFIVFSSEISSVSLFATGQWPK